MALGVSAALLLPPGGAVAQPQTVAPAVRVVAGGRPQVTSATATPDGVHRVVALPVAAALRRATTADQVRAVMAGAPTSGEETVESEPQSFRAFDADVAPVGDLDGDKRRDVVAARITQDGVRFLGLKGSTGVRLWRLDLATGPDVYPSVQPLRGRGSAGVLLVTRAFSDVADNEATWSATMTTTLHAVDPDGTVRWSRTYDGTLSASAAAFSATGLVDVVGVGPAVDRGDDVVVSVTDLAYSAGAGGKTTVEVIQGATGHTASVAQASSTDDAPAAGLVGDLDGDGLRDVVVASSAATRVSLTAQRGVDGRPLWSQQFDSAPAVWLEAAGDTTGDGVGDVLVYGFDFWADQPIQATVVSGSDGAAQWSRQTGGAWAVGDIDRDGRADVLTVDDIWTLRALGYRYVAISGSGRRLWAKSYTVRTPSGGYFAMGGMGLVGDVDRDRVADAGHEIELYGASGKKVVERGVVRSRTGVKAFSGAVGSPLHASLDRRGDDLISTRRAKGGTTRLVARDGRNGSALWRHSLSAKGVEFVWPRGADLTGDRRAEVVAMVFTRRGTKVRVLDASGRLLWRR